MEVLKKSGTTERCGKVKNVYSVKQETLCDRVVTDKGFDFHALDGSGGQPDAIRLERTLYMTPCIILIYILKIFDYKCMSFWPNTIMQYNNNSFVSLFSISYYISKFSA